jgi:hypothetical protein
VSRLILLVCLIGCGPLPAKPEPRPEPARPTRATPPPREYPPVTVRGARSRFTLEILGAEAVGTIDPGATKVARTLTVGLRALAGTDSAITLGKKNIDLIDAKTMVGCTDDELACLKKIANNIAVDKLIFGSINDLGEGDYYVVFTLFDRKTSATVKWTGRTQAEDPDLVYTAKVAFDSLIWQGS